MIRASVLIVVGSLFVLAGCTEREQVIGQNAKQDKQAFQGTGMASFTAPGWKQGDKLSWEQQLKARAQNTQNDYAKVN